MEVSLILSILDLNLKKFLINAFVPKLVQQYIFLNTFNNKVHPLKRLNNLKTSFMVNIFDELNKNVVILRIEFTATEFQT